MSLAHLVEGPRSPFLLLTSHFLRSYFFGISNRFPTTVQFTTFHHAVM